MTLLVTEIHNHTEPARAVIVFGADRRISHRGKYYGTRKKLFPIQRHKAAAIGYFGLAAVGNIPMDEWLRSYLRHETSSGIAEFAKVLAARLNVAVPAAHRTCQRSGFHISGFTPAHRAEFWFVRNITDSGRITGSYAAREDFQRRDAPRLPVGEGGVYRNGDILPHELVWGKLDKALRPLLNRVDFRRVRTESDYARWVQFKFEVVAYAYKRWCTASIIGGPEL